MENHVENIFKKISNTFWPEKINNKVEASSDKLD